MKRLTYELISQLNACGIAQRLFAGKFPTGSATVKEVLDWLIDIDRMDWLAWSLGRNSEMAKAFLNAGADINAHGISYGDALYWAFEYDQMKLANFLIRNGFKITNNNRDQLCEAAERNQATTVQLILDGFGEFDEYCVRKAYNKSDSRKVCRLLEHYAERHGFSCVRPAHMDL